MFNKLVTRFYHSKCPLFCAGVKQLQLSNLPSSCVIPSRSTYVLRRKYPVKLLRKGVESAKLKAKNFVYELVEDTEIQKKPDVQVILKTFVEGLGNSGDCVSVKRNEAYYKLLLPGLAEYATPTAIEEAKQKKSAGSSEYQYSSPYAAQTMKYLQNLVLAVVMNKETEWTIEPWHIRASFRKAGVYVPESAIKLPDKKINGPDLNLQAKDFVVTVTINNREKVNVRCRIHHWGTNPGDRLAYVKYPWTLKSEPIFEEDASLLEKLPLPVLKTTEETVQ